MPNIVNKPNQATQLRASFLICLILSTLGPSQAERLHVEIGDVNVRSNDNNNNTGNLTAPWWSWDNSIECPAFLTANQEAKICTYPDKSDAASDLFKSFSQAPLQFNHTGSTFMTNSQFVAEIGAAFVDKPAQYKVGASLANAEAARNETFRALLQQSVSDQHAHEHSDFHHLEENLKPGFFVAEHMVEHSVVHGLEVGFHALAHAAEHGSVFGEALLAEAFGLELAELALGASAFTAFLLEWVMPILLPFQIAFMVWQVRKLFKEQTHHTKAFTSHLVMKSDCMISKLRDADISGQIHPAVEQVCGPEFEKDFETQVHATFKAKLALFETIANLGRCMWPHGDRAWSKINCVEIMYYKLLQSDGNPGILYDALSVAAYYGFRMDEMMKVPEGEFFGKYYHKEFGIDKTAAEKVSLLPRLLEVTEAPIGKRWPVCMQLMSTNRAFERTFQRLNEGMQVWLRSYARAMRGMSIRDTWWPCQKTFYSLLEEHPNGFCKKYDWKIGHGRDEKPIDEKQACKQAEEFEGSLWPETEEHDEDGEGHDEHKK